ncbi:MAG: DUF1735 domain-containing protein [Alistipes sp.]|nr:DUF1735 domain-containing protein [Alistipes sp.]
MKKLYIAACVALLMGATACENNRNANLTEAHVYIVNDGFQVAEFYDLDHEPAAKVSVHRSGFFEESATVTAAIDLDAIAEYNAANGTQYEALTEGTYWLNNEEVVISGAERTGVLSVGFDYDTIAALPEGHNYVVPVRISSETKVNEAKSLVLLSPSMLPAEIFFMPNHEETVKWSEGSTTIFEKTMTVSVPFNNPIDCTVTLDTSDNFFKTFKKYINACPAEAYEIVGDNVLAAGESELKLKLRVDLSKIPSDMLFCAIPVVLTANSENYVINQDNRYMLIHLQKDGVIASKLVDGGGDRTSIWTLLECNSAQGLTGQGSWNNMIDGDYATYWNSAWKSGQYGKVGLSETDPYIVAWDMGQPHNLVAIELTRRNYTSRQDVSVGYVEVSADGVNWKWVAEWDHVTQCGDDKTANGPFRYEFCSNANVQYVRICVTKSLHNNSAATDCNMAELNVYELDSSN